MLSRFLISVAGLAPFALAADITFASDANCTGNAVSGATLLDTVPCTDISWQTDVASVVLANIGAGQGVTFYTDNACTVAPTTFTTDSCYSPGSFGSFIVTNSSYTTDVVPYDIKLSNYRGLEKSPYSIDATFSRVVIGYSVLGASSLLSFSAFITGCVTIDPKAPDPVAIFVCVAVPISTLMGAAGTYILHQAGKKLRERIEMRGGNIVRSLSDHTMEAEEFNEMWADMLLNGTVGTDMSFKKIGYLKRDMGAHGVHLSPALEIEGLENTGKWHVTAHFDHETNAFIHHIQHASQWDTGASAVEERGPYTYNSIRWNANGIDATICEYGGNVSGFGDSKQTLYKDFFSELKCYAKPGIQKAKFIQVDLYSETTNIPAEMHFAGYKDGGGHKGIDTYNRCLKNQQATFNQDCAAE